MRNNNRSNNELRKISIETNVLSYAEGSCLIRFGNTHILCSATIDDSMPKFLKGKGQGWLTAEYSMLPRSTSQRVKREVNQGKPTGRTHEIQRLIGRTLRSICDLKQLGERQIIIDCDVLQADGGTRTASITGAYIALYLALKKLVYSGTLRSIPLKGFMAAVSCGIYKNQVILDLDFNEDSEAEVDANFVLDENNNIIEIQMTGEERPFSLDEFMYMLDYAKKGVQELITLQKSILLATNNS